MARGRVQRKKKTAHAYERSIKEELVKLSESVRSKFRALKRNTDDMERYLEATSKPIVGPLQKSVVESIKQIVKKEPVEPVKQEPEEEEDFNKTFDTSTQTEDSADYYLRKLSTPDHDEFDTTYGIRLDGKGDTQIGNSKIVFANNNIYVRAKSYKATDGLLQLLFMKAPDRNALDSEDLKNYREIVHRTNAHRQMYSAERPLNANRGVKYKYVISALFGPTASPIGKGMAPSYDSDANTLVDRLRMLVMSQRAGHTGHQSEIEDIILALRINNVIA